MEAVLTEPTIKLKSRGDFRLTSSFPKILEWVKLPQKTPSNGASHRRLIAYGGQMRNRCRVQTFEMIEKQIKYHT